MNRKHLNFAALSASTKSINDLRAFAVLPFTVYLQLFFLCVIGVICGCFFTLGPRASRPHFEIRRAQRV
jgi:hypothetical protein